MKAAAVAETSTTTTYIKVVIWWIYVSTYESI